MEFDEVVTFFELFIQFSRQKSNGKEKVGEIIDKGALIDLANQKFFTKCDELNLFQIACMYWIYNGVGSLWSSQILEKMEN